MDLVKQFFINIDREDISESDQNLVSSNVIDSIDIMALVSEIEKHFHKPLDAKFMIAENFESMQAVKKMIDEAMQ